MFFMVWILTHLNCCIIANSLLYAYNACFWTYALVKIWKICMSMFISNPCSSFQFSACKYFPPSMIAFLNNTLFMRSHIVLIIVIHTVFQIIFLFLFKLGMSNWLKCFVILLCKMDIWPIHLFYRFYTKLNILQFKNKCWIDSSWTLYRIYNLHGTFNPLC